MILNQRINRMGSLLLLTIFLLSITNVVLAAEDPITATDIYISVWPEYDQPGVLVLYSGEVKNNSTEVFDGYIKFNVPKEAGKMDMVCEYDEAGRMICIPNKIEEMEDFKQVSWRVNEPLPPGKSLPFMIQFYYDPIQGEVDKNIEFEFVPTYNIDNLIWDVKEPLNATNFTVEPSLDFIREDPNNFKIYGSTAANVAQNEMQTLSLSYTRADQGPSITKEAALGGNAGTTTNKVADANKTLVLVLVVGFLGVIGFFAVYALKNNKESKQKQHQTWKNKGAGAKKGKKTANNSGTSDLIMEKKKIRKMLLDGKISEETYQQLVVELEKEYK